MIPLRIPNGLNFAKQFLIAFTFFFLPLFLFDLGFTGLQIGVLMSLLSVVALFSTFPIGVINDRLSIRHVMMFGMLLESLFFIGLYMFMDFWIIIPFFIIGSLGGNMIDTSIRSLTFKALSSEKKGKRLGAYQSIMSGGFAFGIMLGGFLLAMLNFSGVLLISAAAFLVMALISFLVTSPETVRFPLSDYKSILLKRSTAIFLLPLFLFGIHWGAEHTSFSLFLRESLGLDLVTMGFYMGIPIIILAAVSYVGGLRIDRTGSNKMLFFLGLLLSGTGHILMAYPMVPVSFMFRVVHEIGDGLVFVSYYYSFSRIFKTDRVAGETGAAMTIMIFGSVLGSLIFGPLGYAYGFAWPFIISGVLSLISLVILFSFRRVANF